MIFSNDFDEKAIYINFISNRDVLNNEIDIPNILQENNDWKHLFFSQIYFNLKEYSKSKELAMLILDHKDSNSSLIIAESYNILGRIARLYKLEDDAKAFYESAISYFIKENSFFGSFGILRLEFNQANILLLSSELSKALKEYDKLITTIESLKPMKELETEYYKLIIKIYQNKALTLLYQGKTEESKNLFEKALSCLPFIPESSVGADLFLNYSNLSLVQENYDLAYEMLSKASVLYYKSGKMDIFSKIEIDKVKINLVKNIDNSIDLEFVTNLIKNYEQAKGKEVNLRIVEICELLFTNSRLDETHELLLYLSQKDFLPDLKQRIQFLSMNIALLDQKYEQAVIIGEELLELIRPFKEEESELAIHINLLKANYMLKKDNVRLIRELKQLNEKLLKQKQFETAIQNYEQYFPILFEGKNFDVILSILTEIESLIIKKTKQDYIKQYNINDTIIVNALMKDLKAKKTYQTNKIKYSELLETSRFKTLIAKNNQYENEIKEFLEIA